MTRAEIQATLVEILHDFQGREYSGEITPATRFFGELGFVSIDAIVLGETLEARFGRKLPFHEFFAELARRKAQDVEVGELVAFLHGALADGQQDRGCPTSSSTD
jgi:acyl carrier protein